ncbi:MAG: DNA topoisomerase 4 subunit A, partial [Chloroflexi bacterium]|nr:DNA topoisomerase 4 subunit A [Chloroflexota bacterium]
RILYAMHDMGVRADSAYKKCARIVGEVLGKYHPHGDAAVYEALVRMAQDFSMRYPLVDGQGNFGSIDGDGAAAMRYTEARMAQIGEELMLDINMDTVDFVENFDSTLTEPGVLPANLPNLLVNGASGIAVGMSTNIPPHNLGEVCDALQHMLQNWDKLDDISIADLMRFVKGPDFPTGGLVYRHQDGGEDEDDSLVHAYATGRGKVTIRAKVHIEDIGRGKSRIVVSELPYQTNKSALVERIANLVRDGRLEGVADLRDESDRQGLRLTIELQRNADPSTVLNRMFQLTPLQETFGIIMLALVDNEPRLLSLKQCLKVYLDHRLEVVRRRSEYELARARERAHILEGLLKALGSLDEAIRIIRQSRNADTARTNLMTALDITEIQAQAILDMQLRRLAALERQRIEDEYKDKIAQITYLEDLLASPAKMRDVIGTELAEVRTKYNDPRRTIIADSQASEDHLVPQEETWVTLTVAGKLARSFTSDAPKTTATDKEPPRFIAHSTTTHLLYLFSASGQCATIPVQQIPQARTHGEGINFSELCSFGSNEPLTALLSRPPDLDARGFLALVTAGGEVKRLRSEDLPGMMANAFKIMDVEANDQLIAAFFTSGEDELVLVTRGAQAIRFKESDVRPTGITAGGVRGIKLSGAEDRVVGAGIARPDQSLLTINDIGLAKSSVIDEYPVQGRAGSGVATMKLTKESQGIAAAVIGSLDAQVIILSDKHKARTIKLDKAPHGKRATKGDYVVSLSSKERVAAIVTHQPIITNQITNSS